MVNNGRPTAPPVAKINKNKGSGGDISIQTFHWSTSARGGEREERRGGRGREREREEESERERERGERGKVKESVKEREK